MATLTFHSEFDAPLNLESSFGEIPLSDSAHQTMDFTYDTKSGQGTIEWDIPEFDEGTSIGIWVDHEMELADYDSVFNLPSQAITLLEQAGITVGKVFRG